MTHVLTDSLCSCRLQGGKLRARGPGTAALLTLDGTERHLPVSFSANMNFRKSTRYFRAFQGVINTAPDQGILGFSTWEDP